MPPKMKSIRNKRVKISPPSLQAIPTPRLTPLLMLMLPLALAACGASDDGSGASASESRQLNEAAAMLDNESVSANAVDASPQQPVRTP